MLRFNENILCTQLLYLGKCHFFRISQSNRQVTEDRSKGFVIKYIKYLYTFELNAHFSVTSELNIPNLNIYDTIGLFSL